MAGAETAGGIAGLTGAGALFATGAIGAGAPACATDLATGFALVTAGVGDGGSSALVADAAGGGAETGDAATLRAGTEACAES